MSNFITESELEMLDTYSEGWNDDNESFNNSGFAESDPDDPGSNYGGGRFSNRNTDLVSEHEIGNYTSDEMSEFLPALMPIIQAALPTVLPMLMQAIPSVVQAAGSLFKGISGGGPAPRPRAPLAPAPVAVPAPMPVAQPYSPAGNDSLNQVLQTLLGLLQNPQVLQTITNVASGVTNSVLASKGGNIPASNILGIVSQLSGSAASAAKAAPGNVQNSNESVFPDYVFDNSGKLMIDPNDPVQHAQLISEMINS